jgi:hypothetical protein
MYSASGAGTFKEALNNLSGLMACFSKFSNVHYFTGHTHDIYNVDKMNSANPHFEHNAGAVCATWWWTYRTCQMNLARDGAPGGYTICDFDGADFEWVFKAYDRDLDYQFRAYDMNNVNSSEFPKGYDTYIEQGGTNVSGGQKQRLCIARALLKKPKVLILDDSTSAVDTKTDALIRKAFREYIPDTTKLIIAQRISSVQDADMIIVMDNGKVSAYGTHEDLLEKSVIYSEIYEEQIGGKNDEE